MSVSYEEQCGFENWLEGWEGSDDYYATLEQFMMDHVESFLDWFEAQEERQGDAYDWYETYINVVASKEWGDVVEEIWETQKEGPIDAYDQWKDDQLEDKL